MDLRSRGVMVAAATAALLLASGLAALPANASTGISGSVYCDDGDAVTGVWIQASSGGSGFASFTHGVADATFHYTLPNGGAWTVHVGCGGTTSSWRWTPDGNATTRATIQNWYCKTPDGYGGGDYCFIG
jgi:hypothetical protein